MPSSSSFSMNRQSRSASAPASWAGTGDPIARIATNTPTRIRAVPGTRTCGRFTFPPNAPFAARPRAVSGSEAMDLTGERDRLAQVVDARHVGHQTLQSESEAGVGKGPVTPQVEVPLEGLARQAVTVDLFLEVIQVRGALPATDDLAAALGGEHVHRQR